MQETLSGQATLLGELIAQSIQPTLERLKVSFSTFELLSAVHASGPDTPQAEIARRLGITAPSLTEAVRASVKADLLEQHDSLYDARSKTLHLTRAGVKVLQEILQSVNEAEGTLVQGIPSQDLRTAVQVLKIANRNLARKVSSGQT